MKLKSFIVPLVAAVVCIAGCAKEKSYSDPVIEAPETLDIASKAGDQTAQIKATRAWTATVSYEGEVKDWLTVSPASGEASDELQTLTFTAKENSLRDRVANVKISIGLADATIKVTQYGPGGSSDPVFFNDFDKAAAVQDGSYWPYLYQSDCWKNETGTGILSISYLEGSTNQASVRNNTNSSGSGVNNIFFGKNSRFCVKDITLPSGYVDYTVSFYGIRSVYQAAAGESVFDHNAFKLYISTDNEKWVALDYAFEGGDPDAAWGKASSTFTVPSGTTTLSIGIPCPTQSSTYRIDDLKLDVSATSGTAIDFSKGVEISEFKEGEVQDPAKAEAKTIADFISAADENTYYKLTGTITSTVNETYCSFDMADATASITVWKVVDTCITKYAKVLKQGYKVTLSGKYDYYESQSKHEVTDAVILGYEIPEHMTITTEKVSDVIAAAVGDTIVLNNALVVASAKTGYLVTDNQETGSILVYQKTEGADTPVAVGDKINVRAVRGEYCDMPQLNTPATTVVSSGAQVTWPTPEDITSSFDSFTSTTVKYVSYKGTLSVNGNYYNITVDGATKIGSILPSAAAESYTGLAGVTFKGYYIYTSNGKYIYTIFTEAEAPADYLSVDPETANVAVTAGTTEINVTSNQDWTVSSDNSAFTVSPASGSGNGTVTVTYTANSAFTSRTANITFAVGGTTRATTVITQAAAQDPSASTVELTNEEIKTALLGFLPSSATTAYTNVTISSTSGEWTGNVGVGKDKEGKLTTPYIQLRAKSGAKLLSPTFSKDIEKIELSINEAAGARTIYAMPATTEVPTSSSNYPASLYDSNIGYAANSGNKAEVITIEVTGSQKQFLLLAKGGAVYIDSIKVYFKK